MNKPHYRRTTQNKLFTRMSLRKLFRNRALIGATTINFKEKTIVLHHEPILDVATFEALQVMLDESALRAPRAEVFYALSGIGRCGCGARFEATKTSGGRYYYRCEKHCGEKAWRKDELEWEVHEAFSRYLQQRESQQQYLELAQKSQVKLEQDLAQVERDIAENDRGWKILLRKDLAEYPDIIIKEEKQRLTAERQSLLRAKVKIQSELESLPQVDPVEVEAALYELAKTWQSLRYPISHPEMWRPANLNPHLWERASVMEALETSKDDGYLRRLSKVTTALVPRKLTDERAHPLRETLFKLNCRITIKNKAIFISGKLPLRSVGTNETAS